MDSMPIELIKKIADFADIKTLANMAACNKRFSSTFHDYLQEKSVSVSFSDVHLTSASLVISCFLNFELHNITLTEEEVTRVLYGSFNTFHFPVWNCMYHPEKNSFEVWLKNDISGPVCISQFSEIIEEALKGIQEQILELTGIKISIRNDHAKAINSMIDKYFDP